MPKNSFCDLSRCRRCGPGRLTSRQSGQRSSGMKTAVVEREHLGGICLNWGCIPTKALAARLGNPSPAAASSTSSASRRATSPTTRKRSLRAPRGRQAIVERRRLSACARTRSRCSTARQARGKGKLAVAKDGKAVADLAASTSCWRPARGRAHCRAGTRRQAGVDLQGGDGPEAIPKSLLVVGSGAIGVEFASFYRDMGAEVTVVEVLDRCCRSRTRRFPPLPARASRSRDQDPHRRDGAGTEARAAIMSRPRSRPAARRSRSPSSGDPGGRHRRQCRGASASKAPA
jgi:hypothetical protein